MPDRYPTDLPGERSMSTSSTSSITDIPEHLIPLIEKSVSSFKEYRRRSPKKWGIDGLPYSDHFTSLLREAAGKLPEDELRLVSREAFRRIVALRKSGAFKGKGTRPDLAPQPWKNTDASDDRVPLSKAIARNKTKPRRSA